MPGFRLGIDPGESGDNIAPPAAPIYTYTWTLDILNQQSASNNSLIYIKELSLPEFGVDTEAAPGASIDYKYAKKITWGDIKLTFYATAGLLDILEGLKAKVWSPETGIQSSVNYKFDSTISQYYANDTSKAAEWTLHGSWIRGISHSNLTYANSEVHMVVATVTYDWATVTPSGP